MMEMMSMMVMNMMMMMEMMIMEMMMMMIVMMIMEMMMLIKMMMMEMHRVRGMPCHQTVTLFCYRISSSLRLLER